MANSYLENAYSDETIDDALERAVPCSHCGAGINEWCQVRGENALPHAVRRQETYADFQELVAKMSLDGVSLADIATRLGLVPQRFTAYHAKWMHEHAEPLNLENL